MKLLTFLLCLLSTSAFAADKYIDASTYANLPTAVAAGDHIYAPTGTYALSSTLVLDGKEIDGDGPGKTIITCGSSYDCLSLKTWGILKNLTIQGSATTGASGNFGITTPYPADSTSVKNLLIQNVTIADMATGQVKLNEGTENATIERYVGKGFHGTSGVGWGYGIITGPVKNVHIKDSLFCGGRATGDGRHAVYLGAGARDVWITNNKMRDFMQQGISVDSRSTSPWNERIHIEGNTILNTGDIYAGGIGVFAKSRNMFIDDNYITGGAGNGIHIEGTSADGSPANIHVKHNILAAYSTAFWTGTDGVSGSLVNVSTDNLTPSTASDSEDDFCAAADPVSDEGTIWTQSLTGQAGGYVGYTSRTTFPVSALTLPTGTPTKIRVSYKFGSTAGGTLDAAYIGHRSGTTGHTYNGTPVQITFAGLTSVSGAAGATVVSDWMPFSYNKTDGLVFGEHMSAGGYKASYNTSTATLNVKASINEPGVVTPSSGYTTASGFAQGITKIETDGFP